MKRKMTLYELGEEYMTALDGVELTEDGEYVGYEKVMELEGTIAEKLENIGAYIKYLDAFSENLKEEEDSLKARRRAIENKAEYLKSNVIATLLKTGKKKIDMPKARMSVRESEAVNILNIDLIPDAWKKEVTIFTADKRGIKKAIKGGEEVPGAEIEKNYSLALK